MEGILEVAAHLPSNGRVVDTLAAGDCFIAGTVHFLNEGHRLKEALEKATFLAGESVGQRGLAGLRLPPK
jgi:sugar/nucleoside kinase (ribokinase family)